jgi:hypothetical protein
MTRGWLCNDFSRWFTPGSLLEFVVFWSCFIEKLLSANSILLSQAIYFDESRPPKPLKIHFLQQCVRFYLGIFENMV